MTIRECTIDDIPEASKLANWCNSALDQSTSFMYKDLHKVADSFSETLGKNSIQLLACLGESIVGYIHIVDDEVFGSGDVFGPFVPDSSPSTALALLEGVKAYSSHIEKFKFNVIPSNFLVPMLKALGADENEHNYSLVLPAKKMLDQSKFAFPVYVTSHSSNYDSAFSSLFNQYFDDSYITSDEIIRNTESKYVLLDLLIDGAFIGFVCYRDKIAYLDFLAVDPSWQGRGFGRFLLSAAIGKSRELDPSIDVRLNVDLNSARALKLYEDIGFQVLEEFVSFHLKNSSFKRVEDRNLTSTST